MKDPLAPIEARLKAATPRPWALYQDECFGGVVKYHPNATGPRDFDVLFGGDYQEGYLEITDPDTVLAAHAPSDIAFLLKEIRRLHAILGSFALIEELLAEGERREI